MKVGDMVYITSNSGRGILIPVEGEVTYSGISYFTAGDFTFLRADEGAYPLLGRHS